MKRLFDIAVSGSFLMLLSPLLIAVAAFVRWRLGRPVFFRQLRPGLRGRPFLMLKFRTMTDAHGVDGRLLSDSERLTPLGRFLRATSLDELPELWNVLKGEMSLVGPRPLLMKYLPYYTHEERRRHDVRPGITGWSQVNGRNNLAWPRRLASDVWYVDNRTILLDLRILFLTLKKSVSRHDVVVDPASVMPDLDAENDREFHVARLDRSYANEVAELIRSSYDLENFSHTIIYSDRFGKFLYEVGFDRDEFFGAFREGRLVGVLQLRQLPDSVHLNNIAVLPEERGWGVADALMKELLRAAGGRTIDLFVDSRNESGISFYRKHGYREVGRDAFSQVILASHQPTADASGKVTVIDADQLRRFGFSYLRLDGFEVDIGFVEPASVLVPLGSPPELLLEVFASGAATRVTFPSELADVVPGGYPLAKWDRVRMALG